MSVALEHIGIAVRSLEDAVSIYGLLMGLNREAVVFEENDDEGVKMAFLPLPNCRLELLEPTRPDSPIAKFLETRGEGIHHLCFSAEGDVDAACERLKAAAFRVIQHKAGKYFFLLPQDCNGSLIEFYGGRHD